MTKELLDDFGVAVAALIHRLRNDSRAYTAMGYFGDYASDEQCELADKYLAQLGRSQCGCLPRRA